MLHQFIAFIRNDHGTASIEYGIVIGFFGIAIIGAIQIFLSESGTQLSGTQKHLQTTAMSLPSPAPGS